MDMGFAGAKSGIINGRKESVNGEDVRAALQ